MRRAVPFALVACLVVIGAFWLRSGPEPRAIAQEETTSPPAASPSPASPSAASPSAASPSPDLDDSGSLFGDASASPFAEEEEEPEGIPGLGAVSLIANLGELRPDGEFPCAGPTTGDGDLYTWTCADPSGAYSVEVIGDGPLAVLSVTAVARGVPEREAEEFFGYVLGLCLRDSNAALSSEAFVAGSVPSGGQTFAGDVGVAIYGSREARALEVTAGDAVLD